MASAVRDVCVQFELCRQFAANVHKAEANVAARIEQMLERVYELRRLTTSNPAAAPNSGRAFAFSASPADEITRLLLLFFPDGALKPAVLRRYAGTLWLAEREGIAPRSSSGSCAGTGAWPAAGTARRGRCPGSAGGWRRTAVAAEAPRRRKRRRRRSAIEPVIGHMKADGHLGRNFLLGTEGDASNLVLAAAGHNMWLLRAWLDWLWAFLLNLLLAAPQTGLARPPRPADA